MWFISLEWEIRSLCSDRLHSAAGLWFWVHGVFCRGDALEGLLGFFHGVRAKISEYNRLSYAGYLKKEFQEAMWFFGLHGEVYWRVENRAPDFPQ